jgi:hypothetical protein
LKLGLLEDGRVKVFRGAVMEMQKIDYKKVRPCDYLKNGFFDQSGDWIEGLNGFYSMATAQLLREEGTSPARVRGLAEKLMALSLEVFGDYEILEYHSLDSFSRDAIFKIMDSLESKQSAVLSELFDTARPHLNNWKNFAALVIHLEQISSQLEVVAA